jgi:hypothetical protein
MTGAVKSKSVELWQILNRPLPSWVETSWKVMSFVGAFAFLVVITVADPKIGATLWAGILLCFLLILRFRRPPHRPPRRPPPPAPPGEPPLEPSGRPVLPTSPDDVLIGKYEEPIPVRRVAQL